MSVKVAGSWRVPAQTLVKVAGVWRNAATVSVKVGGAWKTTTFTGPPAAPIMEYLGSGTSNNGLFQVSNTVAGAEYVATNVSGGGSATQTVVSGKVRFQLSSANSRWSVKARWAAGAPESAVDYMERKAATQYFVQTGNPYCCYDPGCASCFGGCGTYYAQDQWNPNDGSPAGYYSCGTPGYYAWTNNAPTYNWSGSNYTNGQGEWWRVS